MIDGNAAPGDGDSHINRGDADDEAYLVPDTMVRFDSWSGCGVNVTVSTNGAGRFVELAFVSERGTVEAHYLTLAQVEQLRAAVDAVTRRSAPPPAKDFEAGEPRCWVRAAPRDLGRTGTVERTDRAA